MSYNFGSGQELLHICRENNKKIWEVMILREIENSGLSYEEVFNLMKDNLYVMKKAVIRGLTEDIKSVSGLVGGDAKLLKNRYENKETISGSRILKAVASAMAVLEVNASMGQVVAAPTAGSCGIIPGVLITIGDEFEIEDDKLIEALFTASAVGLIVAKNATVAGAEGGCQAETGTASAMAAAAVVELFGGSPEAALHAAAMTIKNILGLVCDPIAGLVECPCVKRNAIGTANALICADMALAGIKSVIPFDEVVDAMYKVGKSMPEDLRETALGGLAATPTGKKIAKEIFNKNK
ncbi:L-serine ammonia-lyase [Caminicella sporogenes DSM 14501]|uniref:L-serine dehydratase n=1 Tax=Caminicella sporogenes DSM 14501 TaxID=1121266 RepID=A0A1M6R915_9FIRM|nr:L-serine ammonia-lyase, iron-sulfur-dependent, subunit alpha [Caminicella sporogenes]RKD27345.1 L-serine dehydratase, iron-sulfur-dependent subunit alpha [Caminicella sporogenes]WIF94218.1 L-serine ammonia-lyase, iron-sulfur-dependent, subunit alpha [Caminicella sporogenes]SHK28930.1 L-serine ammonia-lyase [Caminicella sporogenes DSM 14501]